MKDLIYLTSVFFLIVVMTISAVILYNTTRYDNEQQSINYSYVNDVYKCRKHDVSFKDVTGLK